MDDFEKPEISIEKIKLEGIGRLNPPDGVSDIEQLAERIASIRDAYLSERGQHRSDLGERIAMIRDTFLSGWQQEQLPVIEDCLRLLERGIPLPVLSICGRGTREIRYTSYLAYFLNPLNPHGLGQDFLNTVLEKPLKKAGYGKELLNNPLVESEVYIGSVPGKNRERACICDIVIECDGLAVFIEHKIKSPESNDINSGLSQLKNYTLAIADNPDYHSKKHLKIYLTPYGKQSRDESDWYPMTHHQLVEYGMRLLRKPEYSIIARHNLARFLMDIAVGPYTRTEEELMDLRGMAQELVDQGFQLKRYIRFSELYTANKMPVQIMREV